ncbi:helix-turn-helix domain-containing protein [Marinomonas sp. M1K-6]|uniref:Helix-turn-helix domain-containing protein n=1 Tax=Marinomonas profundi TaxID=2726122 RepID=A0A847R7J2_9GAMM|nr:helix-turn-helix domain-containing protein [Marinomonas profundi]NLQ17077.1 helix-turn-helix domain-containing protein [Marinomonas profundi]UDV04724.1 helix-turn-helix domain-containing protein [Marinomonas profundi]
MNKTRLHVEPDVSAIMRAQQYLTQHQADLDKLKIDVLLKNGQKAEFEVPTLTLEVLVQALSQLAKNGESENFEVQQVDPNKMVSPAIAAKYLGMSRPKVTGYILAGQIPSMKVGTHHRVKMADVMLFREKLSNAKMSRDETLSLIANFEQESDFM